ncbi:PilX N-terminal domain-containing pilus assembly protein [Polaromonas sp.]|uniref:pilus assembly PilX family protein n=1 Tax=Polaromonas sp. TaxID=1869339 RepID=UPI0032669CD9
MSAITKAGLLRWSSKSQQGASLIMVMIILTIVSLVGVAGMQISTMSERGARNDRDQQIAWQSAEAALMDAEFDMFGPGASSRRSIFSPQTNVGAFIDGCGSSGASAGLCSLATTGKPAWLTVPFDVVGATAQTTEFGSFTGRAFAAGSIGIQPAKKPRYVIEAIPDQFGAGSGSRNLTSTETKYIYRVTAMGFGPRDDIQALVQMIYRN